MRLSVYATYTHIRFYMYRFRIFGGIIPAVIVSASDAITSQRSYINLWLVFFLFCCFPDYCIWRGQSCWNTRTSAWKKFAGNGFTRSPTPRLIVLALSCLACRNVGGSDCPLFVFLAANTLIGLLETNSGSAARGRVCFKSVSIARVCPRRTKTSMQSHYPALSAGQLVSRHHFSKLDLISHYPRNTPSSTEFEYIMY